MDLNYLKVKDKNHLVRDPVSNGIFSTDEDGYEKYVEAYKRNYNNSKRIQNLEKDFNCIKSDLDEIKMLLKNLSS